MILAARIDRVGLWSALVLLAVLTGLAGNTRAEAVATQACWSCHADLKDLLGSPSTHPPFADGNCTECHQPHASRHAKLLRDDASELCARCHGVAEELSTAEHVHAPVAGGNCMSCHEPHASSSSSLLRESPPALCAECHEEFTALDRADFVHAPVEDDCMNCHQPHDSEQASLLSESPPELCLDCHDTADVSAAHPFKGITKSKCTTCHDPHMSSEPSLLRRNTHPPFAEKKCSLCHESSSTRGYAISSVDKVCERCHSEAREFGRFAYRHILTQPDSCVRCHNPHASNASHLLNSEETQLCTSCHFVDDGTRPDNALTHPGVECGECHLPHGADNDRYLKFAGAPDLCTQCHDEANHSSHPVGDKVIDPRSKRPVTCLSCHQLHSAAYDKYLPLDPDRELCIQCHRK